jgi:alkanesulfonate monooxygenase SsuD/methylene tetrahydromethanopterin reductase-like flavin-dependent oxidoreductase (luciferase family)
VLKPKIANIRKIAQDQGRDPSSIKFFSTFTPILGRTDEEAQEKLKDAQKYASTIGGLVLFSGWTGIDISKIPIDRDITEDDSTEAHKVTSMMSAFTTTSEEIPKWTPRVVAEKAAIGGLGPVGVGSPATVADEMERWIREADVDGFNIAHVNTPGTFEDVVTFLIPELRRRGIYRKKAQGGEAVAAREKIYGVGQSKLRPDHFGSRFKYDVFEETNENGNAEVP